MSVDPQKAFSFVKLSTKPRGEGSVFKLHYRATFAFIMGCCLLVTATRFIGDPIECMPDKDSIPQNVIDTYCYITSTYTIPRYYDQKVGIGGVPHWGLGPELPDDDVNYHNYYMWVPYMLMLQAISFYMPHWLWKVVQTDKVYTILKGLDSHSLKDETEKKAIDNGIRKASQMIFLPETLKCPECGSSSPFSVCLTCSRKESQTDMATPIPEDRGSQSPEDKSKKKDTEGLIVDYLEDSLHTHNLWAAKYVFCEVLNFVNVLLQISFTNTFLGGEFSEYGPRVVRFLWTDSKERMDPMYAVFPRVTKCKFWKYGPSGTVQKHDALCVLAINIIHEKIYVALWFWFVILAILSGMALIYRVVTLFSPSLRANLLRQHCKELGQGSGRKDTSTHDAVDNLIHRFQYGDWYLMHSLGKAMGNLAFTDVLKALDRKLNGASSRDANNEKNLLQGNNCTSV